MLKVKLFQATPNPLQLNIECAAGARCTGPTSVVLAH